MSTLPQSKQPVTPNPFDAVRVANAQSAVDRAAVAEALAGTAGRVALAVLVDTYGPQQIVDWLWNLSKERKEILSLFPSPGTITDVRR